MVRFDKHKYEIKSISKTLSKTRHNKTLFWSMCIVLSYNMSGNIISIILYNLISKQRRRRRRRRRQQHSKVNNREFNKKKKWAVYELAFNKKSFFPYVCKLTVVGYHHHVTDINQVPEHFEK